MIVNYNIEKLDNFLKRFYDITGLSIAVWNTDFQILCHYPKPLNAFCLYIQSHYEGKRRCILSDQKLLRQCAKTQRPATHICHAGLTDTAVPIIKDGVTLGYFTFGQVSDQSIGEAEFDTVNKRTRDLQLSLAKLRELYGELSFRSSEYVQSAAAIMDACTKYLWLEHYINVEDNSPIGAVIKYIHDNIDQKLSIEMLCKKFHMSKNLLYREFKRIFNNTVNGYITDKRILYAENLLLSTSEPVYSICQSVGIDDYPYFCKLFKKRRGISPLKYRKNVTIKGNGEKI